MKRRLLFARIARFCRNAGSHRKQGDDHCDKESNVQGKSKRLALGRLGAQLLCCCILFAQRLQSNKCKLALRQSSVCNETSVQSQSERDKTVAGNENDPPS